MIDIRVSVPSPVAVYVVLNTIWGQPGIPNAAVTFLGRSGHRYSVQLTGGVQIRDDNNDGGVNAINETTTQEWWTDNLHPQPEDQSKREDGHRVGLSMFAGDTLTDIIASATVTAAK